MPDLARRPDTAISPARGTWALLGFSLLGLAVVVALTARFHYDTVAQLFLLVAAFVTFVPGVIAFRRLERRGALRHAVAWLFGISLLLQILAVTGPPGTSDDDWRYLWDGRVQVHGIDPYRYSARAHQLEDLRTDAIFPPSRPCHYHAFAEDGRPEQDQNGCTRMNRPRANTVYPPVAEGFFALMYIVTFGGHGNEFSLQVAGAVGMTLIGWLLWRRARARGDPLWTTALWLWCPTVVLEAVQNAHIDWLGVLFVTIAITVVPARFAIWRGLLLGAAVGVKLYPGLVGASFLRRRPIALVVSAVLLFAVSYVPHVLAVGTQVIGFLPSYLVQEDYTSGTRFLLIGLIAHGTAATVIAAIILVAAVIWAIWRGDPDHPERTAVVLFGVTLLVATPNQAWYALLLIMLAVLARRPEWLVVGLAMGTYYLANDHVPNIGQFGVWVFVAALFVVVGTTVWRQTRDRPVTGPPPANPLARDVRSAG